MRSMNSVPAVRRRSLAAVVLTAALATGSTAMWGQTPATGQPPTPQEQTQPPSQPAPQPAAPPAGRVFTGDAGLIFNVIKPDKSAAFEAMIAKAKEALQKAEDPVRKQQAASWKVFKMAEPDPKGNILYLFVVDPAVKGADYTITKILSEGMPTEAQAIYETIKDAYAGQSLANLQLVANFGTP